MTAFIQTANGDLLNVAGISKLHIDYVSSSADEDSDQQAVFADRHLIGTAAERGNLKKLLENLAVRTASYDGVFGIEEGSIYRQYSVSEHNGQRTIHYGTGENVDWNNNV